MSIKNKALLVNLTIKSPSFTKKDKEATEQVARDNNAQESAGNYNKRLIGKDFTKDLTSLNSEIRKYFYKMTSPWSDEGPRILSTKIYTDFVQKMQEFQAEQARLVDNLIREYNLILDEARTRLGNLFNSDEYKSEDEIREAFSVNVEFMPIPDSKDWRLDLTEFEVEALKKDTESKVKDAATRATRDAWDRLYKAVSHLADRLKADGKFFESNFQNVYDVIDVLPALNITGDPKLTEMEQTVREAIRGYNADRVRESADVKKDAAAKVDEVLARMAGYVGFEEAA